jgi:hypothetical protein
MVLMNKSPNGTNFIIVNRDMIGGLFIPVLYEFIAMFAALGYSKLHYFSMGRGIPLACLL